MRKMTALISVMFCTLMILPAKAEPVNIEVVLKTTDSIRMDFADGSKHFVLMVRREGVAKGAGLFGGAKVEEYGWHDLNFPINGDPLGYLAISTANGDIAYLKWHVRGVFLGGEKKGPAAVHGIWELVSGTGVFASMSGLGAMQIAPAAGPDRPERRFSLQGDITPKR
jgi:hypothetical protein